MKSLLFTLAILSTTLIFSQKKREFKLCDDKCYVLLEYFQDTVKTGKLSAVVYTDSTKIKTVPCVTIYISDRLTSVAKIKTNHHGTMNLPFLKEGVYDVEFHIDGQYFRYYDVMISPFQTVWCRPHLGEFMDKKTYYKALRKFSKNRWRD